MQVPRLRGHHRRRSRLRMYDPDGEPIEAASGDIMADGIKAKEVEPSEAEISVRAHELWQRRGCPVGDPLQDWYAARIQLQRERATRAYEAHVALFE